ncbi:hypothetical protein [Marinobacter salexigens]|uniref:AI-2E family transporter n=1 Tax=Marinobacter salexigens TaxID=1925763 RepID=A0ABS6A690_9GAMM|nr:hypothetical protein [Marinobacter salexigens]MBU2873467.1 hypothetical protein [Marinobacter salexigens]
MNPFILFTLSGPLAGAIGWFSDIFWLFWIGVALAVVNLVMNLASGVMKLPVLPLAFILISAVILSPWHLGAGVGLLIWTTVESVGELMSKNTADAS